MVKAESSTSKLFVFVAIVVAEIWLLPVEGLNRDYQCFTPGECKNRSGLESESRGIIFGRGWGDHDELVFLKRLGYGGTA